MSEEMAVEYDDRLDRFRVSLWSAVAELGRARGPEGVAGLVESACWPPRDAEERRRAVWVWLRDRAPVREGEGASARVIRRTGEHGRPVLSVTLIVRTVRGSVPLSQELPPGVLHYVEHGPEGDPDNDAR